MLRLETCATMRPEIAAGVLGLPRSRIESWLRPGERQVFAPEIPSPGTPSPQRLSLWDCARLALVDLLQKACGAPLADVRAVLSRLSEAYAGEPLGTLALAEILCTPSAEGGVSLELRQRPVSPELVADRSYHRSWLAPVLREEQLRGPVRLNVGATWSEVRERFAEASGARQIVLGWDEQRRPYLDDAALRFIEDTRARALGIAEPDVAVS